MKNIDKLVSELPEDLQREVIDFVDFLIEKRARKAGTVLRQDWAGALAGFKDQYSSLALQKKAVEWRED